MRLFRWEAKRILVCRRSYICTCKYGSLLDAISDCVDIELPVEGIIVFPVVIERDIALASLYLPLVSISAVCIR